MNRRDIALVINMSGGKDSVRMLGFLCEMYPDIPKYAVYSDTGFEHIKPVTAEAWSRERCAAFGVPLYSVRNPNKTYLQMVERRGMFPSATNRQCTSDLKRGPIQTWIRKSVRSGLIKQRIIINCMGIRAAESAQRAKQNPLKRNDAMNKGKDGKPLTPKAAMFGRVVWDWLPIFRETLADVLDWHRETKTPLHPVYVWAGGYLRRFSCRVCIFSTSADIRAIHQHDREAFDLVSRLEVSTGFTMRSGQSLVQIVAAQTQDDDGKQYGSEESYEIACI